jgi:hypothetical protein
MLFRRQSPRRALTMPFAPFDLLLLLTPTSALLAIAWGLRRLAGAPGVAPEPAVGAPAPEPERHGELVPVYVYAPADA